MSGAEHFSDSDLDVIVSERTHQLRRAQFAYLKARHEGTLEREFSARQEMSEIQESLNRALSMRRRIHTERSYA